MLKSLFVGLMCLMPYSVFALCEAERVAIQVLGSGGPELDDGRSSSSYLVWLDDKAKLLIDTGPGASVQFGKAGAQIGDLDGILLTHLHVDHSADLPAFVKGSFFSRRRQDLAIYGPAANHVMPATTTFVDRLFGEKGAFPYLADYVDADKSSAYKLKAQDVALFPRRATFYSLSADISLAAIPVHHGPIAAVAWRVEVANCVIAFSGDMNNDYQTLKQLAAGSDMLVIHNAVPETASGIATRLHMTPSQIGQIAAEADVKQLVISHRMKRTIGFEPNTRRYIELNYSGPIHFAEDLDRFIP